MIKNMDHVIKSLLDIYFMSQVKGYTWNPTICH